ncbi:MAG: hypothetical protein ACLFTT_01860 [Candidatus Hydrogenedentota bacterium]
MRNRVRFIASLMCGLALLAPFAAGWEHHPLITEPILSTMPEVAGAAPVAAVPLEDFLLAHEAELAELLAEEEAWARSMWRFYAPRPEELAFEATGNEADVRARFFRAIRINPNMKTPLYVSALAANSTPETPLEPSEVTLHDQSDYLSVFNFEALQSGERVAPLDVVATASNEPDYGMDTGLYENNDTAFGQDYGFGAQPFGNAALDYGTQAPFHMGFYHESWIVFFFAPFLKECYPEHRIHLYKALSQFAFDQGEDYWGWRFMGWGLHYVADLSMPYHTTALPGYTPGRMLWVYFLDILGWPQAKDNAVQLSSNRHMALERYQGTTMAAAWARGDMQTPPLAVLFEETGRPAYSNDFPRKRIAATSHAMSARADALIVRLMPSQFVNDPSVELSEVPAVDQIAARVESAHGAAGLEEIDRLLADALEGFAVYGRSYARGILVNTEVKAQSTRRVRARK